ncbi:MAG: GNAT family N-acetyltransferase [bacterium]|nr:GNAT family N-acetyltransferase [bacterium]
MITVARSTDVAAFYQRVHSLLMEDETAHILPLGLLNSWTQTGIAPKRLHMAYSETDQHVQAVVMRVDGMRAILTRAHTLDGVRALADDLYSDQPDTPGAMGFPAESRAFVEQWQHLSGQAFRLNRAERIYRLETVIPVNGVRGSLKKAGMEAADLLADWLRAFELEADPSAQPLPMENYRRGVMMRLESSPAIRGLYVWVDDGEIVSMAGYAGPTPNGIRVGPVYTPPEKRGHGYASALTAALTQSLLDQGRAFVALFTDLSNPTSNAIYQKIGYQPVCDVDEYVFVQPEGG